MLHTRNKVIKDKNHMIILEEEKPLKTIQHSFMTKSLKKIGIEGTYLKLTKVTYGIPAANIILNEGKCEKSGMRVCTLTTPVS